jgi:hypothetical protein
MASKVRVMASICAASRSTQIWWRMPSAAVTSAAGSPTGDAGDQLSAVGRGRIGQ